MKYIKTYENIFDFFKSKKSNEPVKEVETSANKILGDSSEFKFAIDVSDAQYVDMDNALDEFEKYFEIQRSQKTYLKRSEHYLKPGLLPPISPGNEPNFWLVNLSNSEKNFYKPSIDNSLFIQLNCIQKWKCEYGPPVKEAADIISIEDFLEVGLTGVKEYINFGKDVKKYNL